MAASTSRGLPRYSPCWRGGNRDAKAKCAFTLYDLDGDGHLSVGEMAYYLHAVYWVVYEAEPSTKEQVGGGSR